MAFDLEIEELGGVAGAARGLRDQLEAKRFEAKKNLGVKQRARVNEQESHCTPLRVRPAPLDVGKLRLR